ncbi:MAG: hypothetical protein PF447_10435, partial [Spirochaetaceae bacterium]|nr:hypothetical protein [Spirochaetaceae bacterium]
MNLKLLPLFICLNFFLLPLSLAADTNEDLYQALLGLASEDDQTRQDSIGQMERIGGPLVSELFEAYRLGELYFYNDEVVLSNGIIQDDRYVKHIRPVDVFTREYIVDEDFLVPLRQVLSLSADRNERKLLSSSQMLVQLTLDDKKNLLNSIRRSSDDDRALDAIPLLETLSREDRSRQVRFNAAESLLLIELRNSHHIPLEVINRLGEMKSLRAYPLLEELTKGELEPIEKQTIYEALRKIRGLQRRVKIFDVIKSALSTGSILILMALGLAVTFGMMGIINMAHGELMRRGAYTTYCIQLLFGHTAENPVAIFYIFALPMSFLASALVGGFIEWSVVRRLYKKPIESLLATYGISLILVQLIRLLFGDNRATNTPQWLQGAVNFS